MRTLLAQHPLDILPHHAITAQESVLPDAPELTKFHAPLDAQLLSAVELRLSVGIASAIFA